MIQSIEASNMKDGIAYLLNGYLLHLDNRITMLLLIKDTLARATFTVGAC